MKSAAFPCARASLARTSGFFQRPCLANRQHLFRRSFQNVRHEMQDVSDTEIDRDRVPRRAYAEGINMAAGEAVHHVGRRQHHQPHVLIGIDTAGGHPEPELIVVGRERERHAEGERFTAVLATCGHHPRQRFRGHHRIGRIAVGLAHDGRIQRGRHRDGVAVQTEIKGRNDGYLDLRQAERRCDGDRRQQMGCIEQADIELVADVRPRHLAHQCHVEAFGSREAFFDGDNQRGGVNQRDETDRERCICHFNNSAAVTMDWAISPIFFFSRIAVERIST